MSKIERCFDVEFRASEENEREVEGYAVVFNTPTDLGWFTEEIDRHAFDEADMSNVYLLGNHDENIVLAGTSNNSLRWEIDDRGVFQRSNIIDTGVGEDWLKLVKNGLINKQSFAFTIAKDGEEWTERNGKEHRLIRKVERVFDFSLVTYPAYPTTSVRMVTDELAEEHKRRVEQSARMERILNGKDA